MPVYFPLAGSGRNSAGGLKPYDAVWKLALENATLSPATIVTFPGKNESSVAPFGVPAGGGACSPRKTVNVFAAAAWPASASAARNAIETMSRFIETPPVSPSRVRQMLVGSRRNASEVRLDSCAEARYRGGNGDAEGERT